ncbi:unnamed protein product [Pylaiella littoralis]
MAWISARSRALCRSLKSACRRRLVAHDLAKKSHRRRKLTSVRCTSPSTYMCHGSSSSSGRLFPSLALFGSFFLLGVFISALGPAVPSLSRDLAVAESSFGTGFTLRGLGYLLGSWCSSLTLPMNVLWIDDRMHRLGVATAGIGLFALALGTSHAFWLICILCFCQGLCGGMIDVISNVAISAVHGADVAPWMQGLHFSFSAGALLAPAAIGQLGYRTVFLTSGLLALPTGVVCWLVAPAAAAAAATALSSSSAAQSVETSGNHHLLFDKSNEQPLSEGDDDGDDDGGGGGHADDAALPSRKRDAEMVEVKSAGFAAAGATVTEPQRPQVGEASEVDKEATLIFAGRHQQKKRCEQEAQTASQTLHQTSAAPATSSSDALVAQSSQEDEESRPHEGGEKKRMGMRSVLLSSDENVNSQVLVTYETIDAEQEQLHRNYQLDEEVRIPLHEGESEDGRKLPSSLLVGLLVLFFFLYVGMEVGFGAWVAVVVLRDELVGEAGAAMMASLFWGGITAGRLLAIPLAVRFSPDLLMKVNLVGGLLSSALLWLIGRDDIVWAAMGAGLFGLFMASVYPLGMSLLPSVGYVLSDKFSSRFVIGGALGEMLVPAFIALLLGPNSDGDDEDGSSKQSGRPAALYDVCFYISVLLVVVYGTWCSLLSPAATASL